MQITPERWFTSWLSVPGLLLHFINTTTFAARDFSPRRGASDAHTLHGSVRSEQRRLGRKAPSPGGLRRFSVLASLLLGHSPTSGDAPSSRLARTENRRNKRGRIYGTGYLGNNRPIESKRKLGGAGFHKTATGRLGLGKLVSDNQSMNLVVPSMR